MVEKENVSDENKFVSRQYNGSICGNMEYLWVLKDMGRQENFLTKQIKSYISICFT